MDDMKPRVAINGFGRIGRLFFRANLIRNLVDIVAINDLSPPETTAYLLKHDSSYGTIPNEIGVKDGHLVVDGKTVTVVQNRDPTSLPWKDMGIDLVVECTGVFTDRDGASKHLTAGAKRVLISAPAKDPDVTIVLGVNLNKLDLSKQKIISMASCTTGSLAPAVKILNDTFGIVSGLMTTIHSYTNDQVLQDQSHRDLRRGRAAAVNIIPTSTGAAKAIGEVIPEVAGKLNGVAVRVPTPTVSLTDLVCTLKKPATKDEINSAFRTAALGPMKGILEITDEPLVSMDFKGNTHSSIIDASQTLAIDSLVKVFAWYDNEWGYSMRLCELAGMLKG